jgi:hypothetical protein
MSKYPNANSLPSNTKDLVKTSALEMATNVFLETEKLRRHKTKE